MFLTLALLVISCSIVVLFSDDFIKAYKKACKIKVFALLAPLFIASVLVLYLQPLLFQILHQVKAILDWDIALIAYAIPLKNSIAIPLAIMMTLILAVVVPSLVVNYLSLKRTYQPWPYRHLLPLYTLVVMILLIILPL